MASNASQRVVIVTGATSGIGKAIAQVFAAAGDRVVACGRDRRRLERLADLLTAAGLDCRAAAFDVRSDGEVQKAFRQIIRREGRIDLLINNAGVTVFKDLASTTSKEFDAILETGLRALFLTTKGVLPHFLKRKAGVIVNILSYASKTTYTKSAAYSAAKAGAEAMMNVLREEVRHRGIGVINVFPGAVKTPMWTAAHREKYGAQMMSPEDVALAVLESTMKPRGTMVEELVIRPQIGDLRV